MTVEGTKTSADGAAPNENEREMQDRAGTIVRILERCEHELSLLEVIPTLTADEVNAISMALGFVQRGRTALARVV